jgi:hypothetical protein
MTITPQEIEQLKKDIKLILVNGFKLIRFLIKIGIYIWIAYSLVKISRLEKKIDEINIHLQVRDSAASNCDTLNQLK